jgi:hypothetical protein
VAIPAFNLDPPAPPTRRSGLMEVATGPMPMPEHAQTSGAQWWSTACGAAHLYPPVCLNVPYQQYTFDAEDGLVAAFPFVVYASEKCTPVGNSIERAQDVVRQRFELGEGRAVEKALWGGGEGVTGIFEQLIALGGAANPQVTALAASANAADAISLLEQQAASSNYNGPVFIHARPRMSAYLAKNGQFRTKTSVDGSTVYTWGGSCVVLGSGYSGNDTASGAPGATTEAMYVTGRILLWKEEGPLFISPEQVLDRTTNQRQIFGARAYAIGVECLAAATVVTRA